jgi:hypothetical protein
MERYRILGTKCLALSSIIFCNLKGCQQVAGGRSEAQTSGPNIKKPIAPRSGCQNYNRPAKLRDRIAKLTPAILLTFNEHLKKAGLRQLSSSLLRIPFAKSFV